MTDFKNIEEKIAFLRISGSVLPQGSAEQIADTMQSLLDVPRAADDWMKEHQPRCAESFYQEDRVNEALPELGVVIFEALAKLKDIRK